MDDLIFAGAVEHSRMLAAGEVSPRALLDAHLERIDELDPKLNAFRAVRADAAEREAEEAERRLAAGERAPLLGVPVAVKDNTDIAGEATMHGSPTRTAIPDRDSEVVARLRRAGAVIVGKTNLCELAIHPFTEHAGREPTRNPWNLERSAGGSSGGSAAAVAAGMVPLAHASDGGGSIRIPAACCGLYGLKPTRDRVPLAPDDGHWQGLTAFGGLSRTVGDTALFLDAVGDPIPAGPGGEGTLAEAAAAPPRSLRIAISTKSTAPGPVAKEVRAAVGATAELLESLGHAVAERDPDWGFVLGAFAPRYLVGIAEDAGRMEDPGRLERRTRSYARVGRRVGARRLRRAEDASRRLAGRLEGLFAEFDVLLTPTMARPAERLGRWNRAGALRTLVGVGSYVPFTAPWNVTGQPAAAVPAGFTDEGLPLSVQLAGPPDSERDLIALSAQLEAARPWRDARPPIVE